MDLLYLLIVVVVILIIYGVAKYNGLVRLNVQADEAWSDITVQLKRRYDLIPNLVNSVKGYAAHEKNVFEDVTIARSNALKAQGVVATAKAENQLTSTLKSLFAVAENYPQLRASENYMQLQNELVDTEDKIQASRRFYNGVVRDFNSRRRVWPTKVFAKRLGFTQDREFFELDASQEAQVEEPVKVDFDK
jgi:LemA protein